MLNSKSIDIFGIVETKGAIERVQEAREVLGEN